MIKTVTVIFIFLGFFYFQVARADNSKNGQSAGIYIENDAGSLGGPGTDSAYTNGFQVFYIYADNEIPSWARSTINKLNFTRQQQALSKINYALSINHQIFTPVDTSNTQLQVNDRPYAAALFLGVSVKVNTVNTSRYLSVDIGTVGPAAAGQEIQNNFHKIISVGIAKGWKHQLDNEPIVQISVQQRSRVFELTTKAKLRYFDIIPYAGGGLGNVLVAGHIGGLLRLGVNLRDDFGPGRPSSADGQNFVSLDARPTNSYYIFGGAKGNFVLHDIYLDGNTFAKQTPVDKNNVTSELEYGAGVDVGTWKLRWMQIVKSVEFAGQKNPNSFASVSLLKTY